MTTAQQQSKKLINALNDAIDTKDLKTINDKIAELKEKKISIDTAADSGLAPIHRAVQLGHVKIVELLIERGADVNLTIHDNNQRRSTLLHSAVSRGNNHIVRLLLKKGANPNRKDFIGDTALHAAVSKKVSDEISFKKKLAAIFLLLTYGANPWIQRGTTHLYGDAFAMARNQIEYKQLQAKQIAEQTSISVPPPASRLRRAFYTFCIVIGILSVLTIAAGLIIFYAHLAAPFMILWTAGGMGLLSVLALLAISSAFKSSPTDKLPEIYSPVLDLLETYRAKTRIRRAYYAWCFIIALCSMGILGAGIAMYFNAISLPFVPFVAVGGAGVVLAAILAVSFAGYKRWSDNREAETRIIAAETATASKNSAKAKTSQQPEKRERPQATSTSSYSDPGMAKISESASANPSEPLGTGLEHHYTPPQGFPVSLPRPNDTPPVKRADESSLINSFNFDQDEPAESIQPLGRPAKPVDRINADYTNLATTPAYEPLPKVDNNPPSSCLCM